MINIQVALADSTDYNPAQFPELQLRQSWHQAGVPSDIRVRLAGVGLTQLDLWANLGETTADFLKPFISYWEESIQQVRAQQPSSTTQGWWVSAWKKARSLQNSTDSLRQDLTKDPLRIPEMPPAPWTPSCWSTENRTNVSLNELPTYKCTMWFFRIIYTKYGCDQRLSSNGQLAQRHSFKFPKKTCQPPSIRSYSCIVHNI